ncbi:hypothetical protein OBV_27660 [Oscillibacter valericigenes Sjm18-20]|nr:hypothetical protein OBV_27660 [Oscillibacter valericigenes Sjm18-20]
MVCFAMPKLQSYFYSACQDLSLTFLSRFCCTSFATTLKYTKRLKMEESNFKVFSWLNINI